MGTPTTPVVVNRSKVELPVVSGSWVSRPQIYARLDRAVNRSLVLIVAPAGHGKTSTMVSWLRQRALTAAWVTVDPRDRELTRFATHVAIALDRVAPGVAPALFALLTAPDRPEPPELGERFADSLYDLDHDVFLVLDDFHDANTPATSGFVSGLITAAPRRLHTIICSRSKIPLPLSRLRTSGNVEELTGADLRFSVEETRQFLSLEAGKPVDPAQVASVQESVGGWPAAVRLVALSGDAAGTDSCGADEAGHAQFLRDYLGDEVLAGLPEGHRQLLLTVSLVERFNVPLLQALSLERGGEAISRAEIDQLRALDLFREIPGLHETWFAFHPLFREILRGELQRNLDEPALASLRRGVAQWFAGAGLTREAVQHLVALNDIPAAAALIEARASAAFSREDWPAVAAWLAQIPRAAVLQNLELLLASAWVAFLSGRIASIGEILNIMRSPHMWDMATPAQRAEISLLASDPDLDPLEAIAIAEEALRRIPPGRRYRFGYAHLAHSFSLTSAGRSDEALQRTSAFIESASTQIDAASIRGYFARTVIHWQAGRLARCEQAAADQLQLAAMNGLPIVASWGALFLATCAYERGDVRGAARHAGAVIADGEHAHFMAVREAYFVHVLTCEGLGQHDEAGRTLARIRDLALGLESDYQLGVVDSFQARVALMRGDLAAARRWVESTSSEPLYSDFKAYEQPALTRARILVASGDAASLAEADRLLAAYVDFARSRHMALALIASLAVQALLRERQGTPAEADSLLRESLDLAAPEGITQRHAGLGADLQPLLRRALAVRAPQPHARAVVAALEATLALQTPAGAASTEPAAPLLSPLTERERQVVLLLARRLTNSEIGDQLYISPITVKNHVAHICDKLDVSGRRAAVQRAEALGLL